MELTLERKWKKKDYTIGNLYVNGKFFSNTLEDTDRNLFNFQSEFVIGSQKLYAKTAIPYGTYTINMSIFSPIFTQKKWYYDNCQKGRMPRLMNVKGFSGILIHPGNTAADTAGCILVGRNTQVGKLTNSKETFLELYNRLWDAYQKGETITITIRQSL